MIKRIADKFRKLISKPVNYPIRKGQNKNFIFIHINKTGGTSIGNAIGLPEVRHQTLKEIIKIIGPKKLKKSFVFAVVRNPWDKVVSQYKYRVKTNKTNVKTNNLSFKDWVKCTYVKNKNPLYFDNPILFIPQVEWLKDNNEQFPDLHILKFESLQTDFQKLAKIIGISPQLPHLNATKNEHYSKYYDDETIEIVRNWFKEDIEKFEYDFDWNKLEKV